MVLIVLLACALLTALLIAVSNRVPDGMPMDLVGVFSLLFTIAFIAGTFAVLNFSSPSEALNLAFLVGLPGLALVLFLLPFTLRQTVRLARLFVGLNG